jgi:D-glycero-D-manno-heptose 1,7-bisphosphate phosphatase
LSKPAALIDRDGTINVQPPEHQYVSRVEDFELLPGAIEGMAHLADCGYTLAVVSNQRGVARGMIPDGTLEQIEEVIQEALEAHDARVAGFYYCPHLDEDGCDCRKPKPGLLLQAAEELDLDLGASWMIGDATKDVEAGRAAGTKTGYLGAGDSRDADLTAASLGEAAKLVCSEASGSP